jgi:aspartate aminotransferase-like enzyme
LVALGAPRLHHQDPAFRRLHAETVELLRTAFGTGRPPVTAFGTGRPPVTAFGTGRPPVTLPGEARTGLEAAAAPLIRGDDVVC